MTARDHAGNPLSGATPEGLAAFETAVADFQRYAADPLSPLDRALALAPGLAMAHALRAYIHLLGTEPGGIAEARVSLEAAQACPVGERERAHLAAIAHLVAGRWQAAGLALEDIAIAWPRDAIALQVGHTVDFMRGDSRMLRDRIARALPAWSRDVPGYHAVLGMQAFGLEETGHYAAAERAGREAVLLEPRDAWAQHAVAHVMEMQGRARDGIAWMTENPEPWSADNALAVHNWWHVALFHLDLDEIGRVLELFDGPVAGGRSGLMLDLEDASALLWRLHLGGADLEGRWDGIADRWRQAGVPGRYAFNDFHAALAYAGAGREVALRDVVAAQEAAIGRDDDNATFARAVGRSAIRAIAAFAQGDYAEAVRLLRPVRHIAARFGGSHAQRDVLDLTLLEAAIRSGQDGLAQALANERLAMKPASPWAGRLAERARPRADAA